MNNINTIKADMDVMTVHYDGQPIYDIVFQNDFSLLAQYMEKLDIKERKICVVTDSNVAPHYLNTVKGILNGQARKVTSFIMPAGECNKNLDTVKDLYEFLILEHFERNDMLVALGGGVVGDLTGYTAATYLRGIDFVQIPTSLLAQVDSSIGGKTGVDFNSYKNMVGAFHQPKLVYINTATLKTLRKREYFSGLGEVIKHGLIADASFYQWLNDNKKEIKELNQNVVREMIQRSCNIKRMVVEEDPKEKGRRALLNFGHTLGHAVEKLTGFAFLHGECVAVGSIMGAYLSRNRGYITQEEVDSIIAIFDYFAMPNIKNYNIDEVLKTVKLDKKMSAGQIKFILLESVGNAFICKDVTDDDMRTVLEEYHG